MKSHLSKQNVLQETTVDELSKQDTIPDVKYQDITYHMDNSDKTVSCKEHAQIDFLKAMNEMKNLDWKYANNYITFFNEKQKNVFSFFGKTKIGGMLKFQ